MIYKRVGWSNRWNSVWESFMVIMSAKFPFLSFSSSGLPNSATKSIVFDGPLSNWPSVVEFSFDRCFITDMAIDRYERRHKNLKKTRESGRTLVQHQSSLFLERRHLHCLSTGAKGESGDDALRTQNTDRDMEYNQHESGNKERWWSVRWTCPRAAGIKFPLLSLSLSLSLLPLWTIIRHWSLEKLAGFSWPFYCRWLK